MFFCLYINNFNPDFHNFDFFLPSHNPFNSPKYLLLNDLLYTKYISKELKASTKTFIGNKYQISNNILLYINNGMSCKYLKKQFTFLINFLYPYPSQFFLYVLVFYC